MKEQESTYNIVYAADDSFAGIMGVSIISLLMNNTDAHKINLTILNTNISKKNISGLTKLVKNFNNASLRWVKAVDIEKKINTKVSQDRGSISQYSRLFLSGVYNTNINRVLYLDCDTLINGSIFNLWNTDLHGKTIGALKDAFSKYYRKNIELSKNDIIFNSGVMLIDLQKWRNEKIEKKLLKFITSHNGRIQQGDQGALSAILSKETYALNPKYNFLSIFTDYTYEQMQLYRHPVNFYSKNEIEIASKNPIIIHFTSSIFNNRPWEENCKSKYLSKWLKYRSRTPWKEQPLKKDKRGIIKKSIKTIYNLLPINISIFIASIFQAYIRPLKNKF